jgi:hypothetical protein
MGEMTASGGGKGLRSRGCWDVGLGRLEDIGSDSRRGCEGELNCAATSGITARSSSLIGGSFVTSDCRRDTGGDMYPGSESFDSRRSPPPLDAVGLIASREMVPDDMLYDVPKSELAEDDADDVVDAME